MIPDIFLLSLYYEHYTAVPDTSQVDYNVNQAIGNIVGNAHLQARVGYFGICVNPDGGSWLCSNNATALANEVSVDQDPLNLIWLAAQFKDMIVFPYLMCVYPHYPNSECISTNQFLQQHHRHYLRFRLLPAPRNLPRLA